MAKLFWGWRMIGVKQVDFPWQKEPAPKKKPVMGWSLLYGPVPSWLRDDVAEQPKDVREEMAAADGCIILRKNSGQVHVVFTKKMPWAPSPSNN